MPIIGDKQGIRGRSSPFIPARSPLGSEKIITSSVPPSLWRCRVYITSYIPEIQFWPAVSEPRWGTVAAPCGPLLLQWRTDNICTRLPGPDRWWTREQWAGGEGGEEETVPQDSAYRAHCLSKQNSFTWRKRDPSNLSALLSCHQLTAGVRDILILEKNMIGGNNCSSRLSGLKRDSTRAESKAIWMAM